MTITDRVKSILKASKPSRNDDKELWIIYAQKSGVNLSSFQIDKIREMPSFETIRRVRQKIQEQGQFEADPKVQEARYEKYKKVRGQIGASDSKSAEQLLQERGYIIVDG